MLALCVDDEVPLLAELVRAVSASPDITDTVSFQLASKAIEWAKENKPDIAFLDIRLRGCDGVELAGKLREIHKDLPVIFCTGYREYAFEAIQLHVAGYLMKPVSSEAIQKEIDYIKQKTVGTKLLTVNCFGNFEVLKDGKPLHFKRKRSKEVLAYLVDRRGATVSAKELCAVLWEDDGAAPNNTLYLYKLIGDLRATLEEAGAGEVFIRHNYDYSVDTEKIECDYYKFLMGDPVAAKQFTGEYMMQYSWAEDTTASLL